MGIYLEIINDKYTSKVKLCYSQHETYELVGGVVVSVILSKDKIPT